MTRNKCPRVDVGCLGIALVVLAGATLAATAQAQPVRVTFDAAPGVELHVREDVPGARFQALCIAAPCAAVAMSGTYQLALVVDGRHLDAPGRFAITRPLALHGEVVSHRPARIAGWVLASLAAAGGVASALMSFRQTTVSRRTLWLGAALGFAGIGAIARLLIRWGDGARVAYSFGGVE